MVAPLIPWIIGAAGTAGSHFATRAADHAAEGRKLDAVKHVLGVTADQAAQLDALKEKSADEAEAHAALGIDPRKPLPKQASERAREVHAAIEEARRLGVPPSELIKLIAKKAEKLTPEEEGAIMAAPPAQREQVIDMIADKKARELGRVAKLLVGQEAEIRQMWI